MAPINARPVAASPVRSTRQKSMDGPLPSTTARATGLMIAVVTAFLSVLMVYQALTGEAAGIDGVARITGGIALFVLAMVVGILSVAPGAVRDWFARRR